MTESMILIPVRFVNTSRAISVTCNAVTETLTTATLTVGRNYWMAGDSTADASTNGGVGDLIAILQTTLNTHTQAAAGFTVTLSATNIITVTHSSLNIQLHWGSGSTTLNPSWFGFTATNYPSPAGLTTTAPARTQFAWCPGVSPSEDTRDTQPVVASMARAISGLQRVALLSTPKKERQLAWSLIQQTLALTEYETAALNNHSFESNWHAGITEGRPLRYYADASSRSEFGLYRVASHENPLRRRAELPTRWDIGPLRLVRAED